MYLPRRPAPLRFIAVSMLVHPRIHTSAATVCQRHALNGLLFLFLVSGAAGVHGADEPPRAAATRDGADRDLGLPELRRVARDDDVTHHRELTPAAQCESVHRSDRLRRNGRARKRGEGAVQ